MLLLPCTPTQLPLHSHSLSLTLPDTLLPPTPPPPTHHHCCHFPQPCPPPLPFCYCFPSFPPTATPHLCPCFPPTHHCCCSPPTTLPPSAATASLPVGMGSGPSHGRGWKCSVCCSYVNEQVSAPCKHSRGTLELGQIQLISRHLPVGCKKSPGGLDLAQEPYFVCPCGRRGRSLILSDHKLVSLP